MIAAITLQHLAATSLVLTGIIIGLSCMAADHLKDREACKPNPDDWREKGDL